MARAVGRVEGGGKGGEGGQNMLAPRFTLHALLYSHKQTPNCNWQLAIAVPLRIARGEPKSRSRVYHELVVLMRCRWLGTRPEPMRLGAIRSFRLSNCRTGKRVNGMLSG
jgi:hypothetical protein